MPDTSEITLKVKEEFKILSGIKYSINIPDEWIQSEQFDETGPLYCANCKYHGSNKDNIFKGYCLNCADYVYEFRRGPGYTDGIPQNR
tara:strand:+ start:3069 stop:3332 length:264 start_codon:yes stop_codon:yes gene_type:complete